MKPYFAVLLFLTFVACAPGGGNDSEIVDNQDTDEEYVSSGDEDFDKADQLSEISEDDGEALPSNGENSGPDLCLLAEERLEASVCTTALSDETEFERFAILDSANASISYITKFFVPAHSDTPLPALLLNVHLHSMHYDFLREVFSEYYAGLTPQQYETMVLDPERRDYYAGALLRFVEPCGSVRYGFSVDQNLTQFDTISSDIVRQIGTSLKQVLPNVELMYFPSSTEEEQVAESWSDDSVSVYTCQVPLDFESYGKGETVGYVRRFTLEQYEEANRLGLIGWQDILVLEGVPFDLPGVVAGCITGTRQTMLSHLNVRANALRLPNAFVRDALTAFASLEGSLVRLQVEKDGYTVDTEVSYEEALTFWEARRPQLQEVYHPDSEYDELQTISDLSLFDENDRDIAFTRFGGKGTNLSILHEILGPVHSVDGFLIPFSHYFHFMDSNSLTSTVDGRQQTLTYSEFVNAMTQDERFLSDSAYRRQKLNELVYAMRYDSSVPSGLTLLIASKVQEVFGSENHMLRFRSSSNLEDSIEFAGAGLYDSISGCVGDSFGGNPNASACDPKRTSKKTVQDALRGVWSSFWTPKAFDERLYYQFYSPENTAMAVAVTPSFLVEDANGVAFTGLPTTAGSTDMLINTQLGDVSVVQPPTGVLPETVLLRVLDDGNVKVTPVSSSTLATSDEPVLSDSLYEQMGALMDDVRRLYPYNYQGHDPDAVILDLEFKVAGDTVIFKQVRPNLRLSGETEPVGVTLEVPESTSLCGRFVESRDIFDEQNLRTRIELETDEFFLPFEGEIEEIDWIRSVQFGPEKTLLLAAAPPRWERVTTDAGNGTTNVRFLFSQSFNADGITATLGWYTQVALSLDGVQPEMLLLDETSIAASSNHWKMTVIPVDKTTQTIDLSSCTYETLPTWQRRAIMPNGDKLLFDVRFSESPFGTGPAGLVRASWVHQGIEYSRNDYFRLAYTASHHNWFERFLFVLDEPVDGIHAVLVEEDFPRDTAMPIIHWLDSSFNTLESVPPESYSIDIIPTENL